MKFKKRIRSIHPWLHGSWALLLLLNLVCPDRITAQVRFRDPVFTSFTKHLAVKFGQNKDIYNRTVELKMDWYEPDGDTYAQRPAVIFLHGGSLVTGHRSEMVTFCEKFVKLGYVTCTIDYRVGMENNTYNKVIEAGLRATQDTKAAMRYLCANAAAFRIDTTQIFLGGSSAGSVVALIVAYLDQNEIPAGVNQTKWGDIDGASGNPGHTAQVQGVLNYCGAIPDTNWIQAGGCPVASFHGMKDPVVPYDHGVSPDFQIMLCGSAAITRQALRVGITTALAGIPNMGHGVGENVAMLDSLLRFEIRFLYSILKQPALVPQPPSKKVDNFQLFQNFPNPFNPTTTLQFSLTQASPVSLEIFDLTGRTVATLFNESLASGTYTMDWQASQLPAGIYLARLQLGNSLATRKMILLK
ncbi:T9SS type A sorting domain-containing protein [candidate division KSB1 bacterium]|nr:T9SS type A sorting domain-containing protein [candidate division KSB1 bacterium]